AKASSANTSTAWQMAWSIIIRKPVDCAIEGARPLQRIRDNAFHLQRPHCFANVVECYVICDMRNADPWRQNEPDFSAFEFLVELYCVQNLLTRKIRWQTRG